MSLTQAGPCRPTASRSAVVGARRVVEDLVDALHRCGVELLRHVECFMFSTTCSLRLAPVMTLDTCGFFKHHAMASCAFFKTLPITTSALPPPYASALSKKFTPESHAACMHSEATSSPIWLPIVTHAPSESADETAVFRVIDCQGDRETRRQSQSPFDDEQSASCVPTLVPSAGTKSPFGLPCNVWRCVKCESSGAPAQL